MTCCHMLVTVPETRPACRFQTLPSPDFPVSSSFMRLTSDLVNTSMRCFFFLCRDTLHDRNKQSMSRPSVAVPESRRSKIPRRPYPELLGSELTGRRCEDSSARDVYHPDASICTISSSSQAPGLPHTSLLPDQHWFQLGP